MLISTIIISGLTVGWSVALPATGDKNSNLQWSPCTPDLGTAENTLITQNLSCATLEVPLDYTNPQGKKLALSLIKVNATKAPFKGSVLFNRTNARTSLKIVC